MVATAQKVKSGYKRTDAGVIPQKWDVVTYGDAFDFLRTTAYSRDQLSDVGSVRYVHYGDVHMQWNHSLDLDKEWLPAVGVLHKGSFAYVHDGDLIVVDASEDNAGVAKSVELRNVKNRKVIAGLHTFLLRDKAENFVDGFRGYLHTNPLVKTAIDRYTTGLKVYSISKSNLKLVPIPKPPTNEQRAIASALFDVDTLIQKTEEFIAKKQDVKKATAQHLLIGKRRLLGFKKVWQKRTLNDTLEKIVGGGTPSRANLRYWGGKIPWVTVKDFASFNPRLAQETITKDGLNNSASHLIPQGTLIIATRIALGNAVIYDVDVSINQDLKALFFKKGMDSLFMYYWFQANSKMIAGLGSGSTVMGISLPDLKNIEITMPDYDEQRAIVGILSDMDAEIEQLNRTLEKYRVIKVGMMQQLLTGKIRIYGK